MPPSFASIEDVGPRIAATIESFFADSDNRAMVERLRRAGVTMAVSGDIAAGPVSDALGGKSFVISGVFFPPLARRSTKL